MACIVKPVSSPGVPEAVYALVSDLPRMGEWSRDIAASGRTVAAARWRPLHRPQSDSERAWSVAGAGHRGRARPVLCVRDAPDEGPYVRWTYRLEPSGPARA